MAPVFVVAAFARARRRAGRSRPGYDSPLEDVEAQMVAAVNRHDAQRSGSERREHRAAGPSTGDSAPGCRRLGRRAFRRTEPLPRARERRPLAADRAREHAQASEG